MSLTVKNDIAVNIRLNMAGNGGAYFGFPGAAGRYIPLSSNLNADYEYHLQKNMLRNIYDTYRSLTEHAGKTASVLMTLSRLHDTRRTQTDEPLETPSLLRRFAEYTNVVYREIPNPRILLETRRDSASVTQRHTHTENRIKQTVEADFKAAPVAALETVSRTGIKNAAEQVYKKLSEDLRRERLKKGF